MTTRRNQNHGLDRLSDFTDVVALHDNVRQVYFRVLLNAYTIEIFSECLYLAVKLQNDALGMRRAWLNGRSVAKPGAARPLPWVLTRGKGNAQITLYIYDKKIASITGNTPNSTPGDLSGLGTPGTATTGAAPSDTFISALYTGLPAGTVYYSHNHLASGALVTDSAGNEVFRITYTEYGEIDLANSGKFNPATGAIEHHLDDALIAITAVKYTGQEYDPETGFYYYNARYYDPQLGVFTTADTVTPDASDSQAYNRHMYVRGNPILYSDPSGHSWFSDFVSVVATAIMPISAVTIGGAGAAIRGAATGDWSAKSMQEGYGQGLIMAGAGGLAAVTGGAVAGAISPYLGVLGEVGGSIGTGALSGAAGGAVSGAATSIVGNTNIGEGMWKGALAGFAGGGITGSLEELGHLSMSGDFANWLTKSVSDTAGGFGYSYVGARLDGKSGADALSAGLTTAGIVGAAMGAGGLLAATLPMGASRVQSYGGSYKVSGMFTGNSFLEDVGDVFRGYFNMSTHTSIEISEILHDSPNMMMAAHSLGNLDMATATLHLPRANWSAFDAPFFTNLSKASTITDGAALWHSGHIFAGVQGFGYRALNPFSRATSTFNCSHSFACYGY